MSIVNLNKVRQRAEKKQNPNRITIPVDADFLTKIEKIKSVSGVRTTTDLIRGIIEEIYDEIINKQN